MILIKNERICLFVSKEHGSKIHLQASQVYIELKSRLEDGLPGCINSNSVAGIPIPDSTAQFYIQCDIRPINASIGGLFRLPYIHVYTLSLEAWMAVRVT